MAPPSFRLPRLYAILDAETLTRLGLDLLDTALSLADVGVTLLQYRDKRLERTDILRNAQALAGRLDRSCTLILNDYPDLLLESGFAGVHLGQNDMVAASARTLLGDDTILGLSTHNDGQLLEARSSPVDYVAIGPVFDTRTKPGVHPVVGLDGVRRARSLSTKPLVAIGGISIQNIPEVLAAGADSVALISALYDHGRSVASVAQTLLRVLERSPTHTMC